MELNIKISSEEFVSKIISYLDQNTLMKILTNNTQTNIPEGIIIGKDLEFKMITDFESVSKITTNEEETIETYGLNLTSKEDDKVSSPFIPKEKAIEAFKEIKILSSSELNKLKKDSTLDILNSSKKNHLLIKLDYEKNGKKTVRCGIVDKVETKYVFLKQIYTFYETENEIKFYSSSQDTGYRKLKIDRIIKAETINHLQ